MRLLRLIVAAVSLTIVVPAFADGREDLDTARSVLAQTARAYREAPALTDTMDIEFTMPNGKQKESFELVLGSGTDAVLKFQGMTMTAADAGLFLQNDVAPTKYIRWDLEGNALTTFSTQLPQAANPPFPQAALRYANADQIDADVLRSWFLPAPALVGHGMIEQDGRSLHELRLNLDGGTATVHVDPATSFIEAMNVELGATKIAMRMHTQKVKGVPQVKFETAGRRRVEKLSQLVLGEGDPAPNVELLTTDGTVVSLHDLAGHVVVLDFWATWCGPCQRALPMFDRFGQWAASSGKPIKVFAVNCWERTPKEQRAEQITKYWTKRGWKTPLLLDLDGTAIATFGFSSIPHTVVIAPDGTIRKIHAGFDPKLEAHLKTEVEKALQTQG